MEIVYFLLTLSVILGPFGFAISVAVWILGPVDRAAARARCAAQFTMADFFCLLFLLQLPIGAIHSLMPAEAAGACAVLDVLVGIAGSLIWWTSVQSLLRAGVRRMRHRLIFQMAVLPLAYYGTIGFTLTLIAIAGTASDGEPRLLGLLLTIAIALVGALVASARFTRRMLHAVEVPAVPEG